MIQERTGNDIQSFTISLSFFVVFSLFFDFFNLAYARLNISNSAIYEDCILHRQRVVEQKHEESWYVSLSHHEMIFVLLHRGVLLALVFSICVYSVVPPRQIVFHVSCSHCLSLCRFYQCMLYLDILRCHQLLSDQHLNHVYWQWLLRFLV